MSFMITVPPAIIQDAQVYANELGTTVDSLVVEYLASLGRKKVDKDEWLSNWERLVSESSGTTTEPYVFNRADAYEEDEFWSEDLNDGQLYCGIKAINPFK